MNLMIDLLISLPVSLCSCLLLSSPCLRIIDVLGCVCRVCVCGMNRGGKLVAGLSCIFSQRLKQRRDDVTAFYDCCCHGSTVSSGTSRITWMMYDHYLQFRGYCHTPFHCCHTHPCCHTNTHLYTLHCKAPRPAAID